VARRNPNDRHGPVIAVTHPGELPVAVDAAFEVPASEPEFDPILLNIPLQLLAYHVALPRNLAKSVTVE
jgi:glucosamine--fructose-6-phosphate aminotransferase (isomerizing)